MIKRDFYIKKLEMYKDSNLIKVLTGVRRSGKSTILEMFRQVLIASGVDEKQTLVLNFERMENRQLLETENLFRFLEGKLLKKKKNYVFLDEIQNVKEFERVLDGLYADSNVDLYVTGSNAKFLSSDLATLVAGRYVEIKVYPLSFLEYVSAFDDKSNLMEMYDTYIKYGAFPEAVNLFKKNPESVYVYLQDVYETVILKDVVIKKRIKDEAMLQDVTKFLFDNIGNISNPKKISDYLTANNRKVSNHTIKKYLQSLTDSFVIYPVDRYDIKGKNILQTLKKYYVVDLALRRLLSDTSAMDYGRILENVVYLELLRRYQKVWIGKNRQKEIDFVTRDFNGVVIYYQVSLSVRDEKTRAREMSSFAVKDNHQKILLTLDHEEGIENGVLQKNVLKWLLQNK
jgi:hypothetical protein